MEVGRTKAASRNALICGDGHGLLARRASMCFLRAPLWLCLQSRRRHTSMHAWPWLCSRTGLPCASYVRRSGCACSLGVATRPCMLGPGCARGQGFHVHFACAALAVPAVSASPHVHACLALAVLADRASMCFLRAPLWLCLQSRRRHTSMHAWPWLCSRTGLPCASYVRPSGCA